MRQQETSPNTALRYKSALLLACLLSLFLPAAGFAAANREVIAYVFPQHQRLQPGDIAARKLTRINYAFANLQNGKMVNGFPEDEQNIPTLVALKQQNPSLKVLVSVGGWLWSGNFSDMALTKQSREQFIDSVIAFIGKYQLDGLDIDWEYPGLTGAGNRFRPEDKHNYTFLLKELRVRFDHEEKGLGRKLLLSIAAGASSEFLDHTEMGEVQKYVDTVNLMAYDYYEPDSDRITGHHAPLYTNPADPKKISADQSVREFEKAGVPAARIVLGVPFYGHVWGEVPALNNGLYQPGKPVPNAFASYSNITTSMLGHGYDRYWDAAASAPYLYSPTQKTFVSYEDPESLRLKCTYVLGHSLAGIMFWDYAGDPSGTLLDTIDTGLQLNTTTQGGTQ